MGRSEFDGFSFYMRRSHSILLSRILGAIVPLCMGRVEVQEFSRIYVRRSPTILSKIPGAIYPADRVLISLN
jgi:hypothetical protein